MKWLQRLVPFRRSLKIRRLRKKVWPEILADRLLKELKK